jgi:murein L,D-transpeptidase YcbB/YkuD
VGLDLFYRSRSDAPLWLANEASRAAASKLAVILRDAAVDGLLNGPELASRVERALAGGTVADDRIISAAWVAYVRTLRKSPSSVTLDDPALAPKIPTALTILSQAAKAPSVTDHIDEVRAVNPLYSALREAAVKQGASGNSSVQATLERLRVIPAKGRAIVVDAASAQLWMLENGRAVDSMKVVVGKTNSPTPLLAGTIHFITFNPYWHILDDVVRRKVAPVVLKRGVSYLKAARYELMSDWSETAERVDPRTVDWKAVAAGDSRVYVRQMPGPNNMMGAMKFSFDNPYAIFLHDTPHKELFGKAKRTLSLGCVRLEHADRLAEWLLGRDIPAPPVDEPESHVQLANGVPIFITYLTANAVDGQLAFAEDVYGLDTPASASPANAVADTITPSAENPTALAPQ